MDRREALSHYALALLRERQDRLLDAAALLEKARDLDPDGAYIVKALVPLYLALCRTDDALSACRKVLDLDPADYQSWFLYARQLKSQGRAEEALTALGRGVACSPVKEHPDLVVQMHYDRGILYEESHDYTRAEAAYREAARILDHPDLLLDAGRFDPSQIKTETAKTYESIGRVCTQARRYDAAIVAYRRACTLDPDRSGRLSYHLAKVYVAEGKPAEALETLETYLRTQPLEVEAYELKVTLLKQLNRAADVLPELKTHADRDPHHLALRLLLAREYGAAGHVPEADALYKALAEDSPTPEVYHGWFDLCRKSNRMAQALTLFDTAVTKGSDTGGKRGDSQAAAQARAMLAVLREDLELGKALVVSAHAAIRDGQRFGNQTLGFLAVLAGRAHLLADAERYYRDCLENRGFLRRTGALTPDMIYDGLIRVLWEERKFADVEAICRQALASPETIQGLFYRTELAKALAQEDRHDEALREADEAVRTAPDNNRLYCRKLRIHVLVLAGRFDQATSEAQALLKEFTKPAEQREVRYLLSSVYSDTHDYARAEAQLRLILKEDPNDVGAHNDLGYILAEQGKDLEEAERLTRRAIDLDRQNRRVGKSAANDAEGDNYAYLDSLGWVLFRRGQLEEAKAWLEKASVLDEGPTDPVIWDHLGDVYARMDQPARARACWEKAVTLYEKEKRRRLDDRYQEIKRKLQLTDRQP
jgi:tetratricopeptide (TPR) repeat protein